MRVLIAGGGQVGALIASRLVREGNEVVIVEADAARGAQLEAELDAHVVRGSAARVLTLREAGVRDADMLIAVTDSDEVNLLACLIAQVESDARVKIARLRTHEVDHWRELIAKTGVQIDLVIHPETDIADRVMRVVRAPGVSDIRDFAGGAVRLFGTNVGPGHRMIGRTLERIGRDGAPRHSLVAMIFRGSRVIIPHGAETIQDGDHLYVLATHDSFDATQRFFGLDTRTVLRRVFIIGGKQVSIRIAQLLERQPVGVKLFERDAARAQRIAGLLRTAIVLHADGTDQRLLEEEGLEQADAFLALTNDDEDNVIASLLARRVGVPKVIALINRVNYLPLVQLLGINTTVSPRLTTVDRVLQFVRKGRVLSVTTFGEEQAEAIELVAAAESKYTGRRLRDVRFPAGSIVGAIVRPSGEAIVPRGDERIEAGDRVILFTLETLVPKLEAAFLAGYADR